MKIYKIVISITLVTALVTTALILLLMPRDVTVEEVSNEEFIRARKTLSSSLAGGRYSYVNFLSDHNGLKLADAQISVIPDDSKMLLTEGASAVYNFAVPSDGLYTLSADYEVVDKSFSSLTMTVLVNGEIQYYEANAIDFPIIWKDSTKEFPLDKFGDETIPAQEIVKGWHSVDFYNNTYISHTPLKFYLTAGENTVEIINTTSRSVNIGELTVRSDKELISYEEYLAQNKGSVVDTLIILNATSYGEKTSSYIQLGSTTDAGASPYDNVNKKINILNIEYAGNEAIYDFDVAEEGFYHIALHCKIGNDDFSNFCSLKIDGEIPFKEAASFALMPYSNTKWHNQVYKNESDEYMFYFTKGQHKLSLRMEIEPVAQVLNDLQLLIDHINQFSLDVVKITGKNVDKNRTWKLSRYIPETASYLDAYDVLLRNILISVKAYSSKGTNASTLSSMVEALALLDKLREKPDELPLYISNLSGAGESTDGISILKLAGGGIDNLMSQFMQLESIYLYGEGENSKLPKENASLLASLGGSAERLWASYVSPKYVVRNRNDSLNIWVNQSVLHVDTLQKLIDTRYTPETGVQINLSVMPDANKILLSKAAGTNPDLAIGMEAHMPFDLASREALYDMTQFEDFWPTAAQLVPGAFIGYLYDEGVYALPETVNFAVTIYREDVFNRLGLKPPDTWTDVCEMMSELQRFNMSFYMPISTGVGYKWFYQTTPLIYQNNGTLYQTNGLGTTINEPNAVKGLTLLGDLFTTYALTEQVPVFYNSFRFSQTPVGICDAASYITIVRGAPELAGQWKIAPYPGTVQEDGSISRWYVGNGRGAMIFNNSDKVDQCWDFLKWWVSEDIQSEFAFTMQSNYGVLWLSSNKDALKNAPVEDKDLRVILESVNWLRDTPRSPGQYMLERSLSDIWNSMVFDGVPPQVAIDLRTIEIQREFRRKMTEFGLIDAQGNPLKDYKVRELDWVLEKMREEGGL